LTALAEPPCGGMSKVVSPYFAMAKRRKHIRPQLEEEDGAPPPHKGDCDMLEDLGPIQYRVLVVLCICVQIFFFIRFFVFLKNV
jgi:hypothetical protein